jgi:hypothetical protein
MTRYLTLLAGIVLILGSGIASAILTDRWGVSPEPMASAQRLQSIPAVIGDWEADPEKDGQISEQHLTMGQIKGYLIRTYVNRNTGAAVTVLLVCGRAGAIAVHTPDVCFVGAGQQLLSRNQAQIDFDPTQEPAEFTVGLFEKTDSSVVSDSRAFWSWSCDGKWKTPRHPRLAFAHRPALFKLYLTRQLADEKEIEQFDTDPTIDFAKVFLRKLDECLFAHGAQEGSEQR